MTLTLHRESGGAPFTEPDKTQQTTVCMTVGESLEPWIRRPIPTANSSHFQAECPNQILPRHSLSQQGFDQIRAHRIAA